MKWINHLSSYFGVQDLPFDDSDDNAYEANLLQGELTLQSLPVIQNRVPSEKDNDLNQFVPFPLISRDKNLLRDVQTSAKGLLAHPRFTLFTPLESSTQHPYLHLSVELRDQNNEDQPIQIKCAQFDRVIGHGGLLFYVEISDESAQKQIKEAAAFKTLLCPGVWLLLRLCQKRGGEIVYMEAPTRDSMLFGVHDLHCKKCRLSRACEHPCKSVKRRGEGGEGTTGFGLDLNVLLQFVSDEHAQVMAAKKKQQEETPEKDVKETTQEKGEGEGEENGEENLAYLHMTVLGMENSGSLSKGFSVGRVEKKTAGSRTGGRRKPAITSIVSTPTLANSKRSPTTAASKSKPKRGLDNRYPYNNYGTDWLLALLQAKKISRGPPCFVSEQVSLSLTSSLPRAAISGSGDRPALLVFFTFEGEGEGKEVREILDGLVESCRALFELPLQVIHCQFSLYQNLREEGGEKEEEGEEGDQEDALLGLFIFIFYTYVYLYLYLAGSINGSDGCH